MRLFSFERRLIQGCATRIAPINVELTAWNAHAPL
jgi:hypothetical protein